MAQAARPCLKDIFVHLKAPTSKLTCVQMRLSVAFAKTTSSQTKSSAGAGLIASIFQVKAMGSADSLPTTRTKLSAPALALGPVCLGLSFAQGRPCEITMARDAQRVNEDALARPIC